MAWESVQRDGDAALPDGWDDLTPRERDVFRDELEEWMAKADAQPQLFADEGVRAAGLYRLAVPPTGTDRWAEP